MAAGNDVSNDIDGDVGVHEKSYSLFIRMMTLGTVLSAIAAFAVILVIS